MQNKNLMTFFLIMLTIAVLTNAIGIPNVEGFWPFDQMFPSQSPPPANQSDNSSQSTGTLTGQPLY